jgi:hypothetical protein
MIILFAGCLWWSPLGSRASAQQGGAVIAELHQEVIVLPDSVDGGALASVVSPASDVYEVLQSYGVSAVWRLFPDFDLADTLAVARTGEVVSQSDFSNTFVIRVPAGVDPAALAASLEGLPAVGYASQDGISVGCVGPPVYPTDPYFVDGSQWGLWNAGLPSGSPDADVDAPEAWGITRGNYKRISIIDAGVDNGHPDLAGRVVLEGTNDGEDHGFAVTCIAAANVGNVGVAGIDSNAGIWNRQGGYNKSDSITVHAINDAVARDFPDVLNASWIVTELNGVTPRLSISIRRTFANAYKRNIVTVAAVGNSGGYDAYDPAAMGVGIIGVGATDRNDSLWASSTRGNQVDVVAPGVEIRTCLRNGGWTTMNGTSLAAPVVSGISSLLLSYQADLYNDDVANILQLSADDRGPNGYDTAYGWGRVNARRALSLLAPPNRFVREEEASGSDPVGSPVPLSRKQFVDTPPFQNGAYDCEKWEVQRRVDFPTGSFTKPPKVWGRGVASKGYYPFGELYGMGWCEPVEGEVYADHCIMRTYLYRVYYGGNWVWAGNISPSQAVFAWSALELNVPDITRSYYTPEAGTLEAPLHGLAARALFKACPNNDGGTSLPDSARLRVVLRDVSNQPIPNVSAADIYILLDGGTAAQGFYGDGADSVIANSTWNTNPLCPDVRVITADGPTNSAGVAFITFAGAAFPGVAGRDSTRKWGHYSARMPVYVLGQELQGKIDSTAANGSYSLHIKNFDVSGGLGATMNQGEAVTTTDYNMMVANLNKSNIITYWLDYNYSGTVTTLDYNQLVAHLNHNCTHPRNP